MSLQAIDETYTRPPSLDPSSEAEKLRSRFRWLIIIWVLIFITAPCVAVYLNVKGNQSKAMPIKLSNGIFLHAVHDAPTLSKDELTTNMDSILRALFCWTNKGGVEAVRPYVHDALWNEMERQHRTATTRDSFYEEQLRIPKGQLIYTSGSAGVYATFKVKGTLSSKGIAAYVENDVYYQLRMRRASKEKEKEGNALGWYLSDLRKMESEEFYKDEIANEIKEKTKTKKAP